MASYTIWIKVHNPDGLAPIERGNPVRKFTRPTLSSAVGMCNAALFVAGESMVKGPRRIEPGGAWQSVRDQLTVEIVRGLK